MKNKDRFVFAFFVFYLVACAGCTADTNATSISIPVTRPTFESISDVPTPSIFPAFILNVSPKPSASIPFDIFIKANTKPILVWRENEDILGYNSNVCVNYNLDSLLKSSAPFVKYTALLVDDELASMTEMSSTEMLCEFIYPDGTRIPYDCNRHAVCWEAPFHLGVHKATFQVQLRSGEIREYTWYYEIVDSVEMTPTQSND